MGSIWDRNGNLTHYDDDSLSPESLSLVIEGHILDTLSPDEIEYILENRMVDFERAVDEEIVMERSIVRLDKAAQLSRAEKIAEFNLAKERKDPLFAKLMTLWKAEAFLTKKIHQRYGMKAKSEAKKAIALGNKSKSSTMNKVMSKAKSKENRIEGANKKLKSMGVDMKSNMDKAIGFAKNITK